MIPTALEYLLVVPTMTVTLMPLRVDSADLLTATTLMATPILVHLSYATERIMIAMGKLMKAPVTPIARTQMVMAMAILPHSFQPILHPRAMS
jgi:hypothetical protein